MSETWVQITHPEIPDSLVTTTAANAERKAAKGWEIVEPVDAAEAAKENTTTRAETLKKSAAKKKAPAKKKS